MWLVVLVLVVLVSVLDGANRGGVLLFEGASKAAGGKAPKANLAGLFGGGGGGGGKKAAA